MRLPKLIFVSCFLAAVAARAETLDFQAATCADILDNAAARRFYLIWFDGYLAGRKGTTTSDSTSMQARNERIMKACESDRAQKLLPLVEKAP